MNVLHTITSLALNDGGPSRSVPGLCNAQRGLGLSSEIATSFLGKASPEHGPDWIHRFPRSWPTILGRSGQLADYISKCKTDIVQHHGLWHRSLQYAWKKQYKERIPLIVSPRGMLMPWARHHHPFRKSLAQKFIHPRALTEASGWHATSDEEAAAIRNLGFHQPICIAPNGVEIPKQPELDHGKKFWEEKDPVLKQRRVALFYSRFHRKKRIMECMTAWKRISPHGWTLLVVGIEDEFTIDDVRKHVGRINAMDTIRVYRGNDRPPPFGCAELFLFPSRSENFGIVVAEAQAAAVPAIVTYGSPWSKLPDRDSGWFVDWAIFEDSLKEICDLSVDDLHEMGERGRQWMSEEFSWRTSAVKLRVFYENLLHRS